MRTGSKSNRQPRHSAILGLCVALSLDVSAQAVDDGDWPSWAVEQETVSARIALVNEGDLAFLDRSPTEPVHHHENHIYVTRSSLHDGWVTLEQCHRNLDRVAEAQIVFHPERSRALQVTRFANMRSAVAERNTVQLRGVRDSSEVCVRGETRALAVIDDGVYELQNGPFMRRFLDGYYPMRVSLIVSHPESLTLADYSPESQPGFAVSSAPGRVEAEALFEGRLRTRFRFLSE